MNHGKESKLTFSVIYYSVYKYVKRLSKELHVNLSCDEDHLKVFPDVPSTGFKKSKT